jgi:malate/lactate dehydrogenase
LQESDADFMLWCIFGASAFSAAKAIILIVFASPKPDQTRQDLLEVNRGALSYNHSKVKWGNT